jgi:hypothetical protein
MPPRRPVAAFRFDARPQPAGMPISQSGVVAAAAVMKNL